ncbi:MULTISPECIES: hypothetical protein [unclassified Undibacterium]|uniref:hypothetical protein n=1 Tax=unclassified Undibacterium TaxID=2630295 RepID=UPI002AC9B329|nr:MULTISPECIES: hypothetical protein [unclassified Undibacterium]MEB0217133.1 hypothetical protein [Undibacterium sp. 5I2]WPX45558.1 hypothetical protein RHM61_10235 [Undibacterium sp. CCC3.4]
MRGFHCYFSERGDLLVFREDSIIAQQVAIVYILIHFLAESTACTHYMREISPNKALPQQFIIAKIRIISFNQQSFRRRLAAENAGLPKWNAVASELFCFTTIIAACLPTSSRSPRPSDRAASAC